MTLLPRRKNASADCRKYNQQHFPMMTNHQISFTKVLISMREHILETAAGLFYREGLRSVGVDRIIADAGIAKATLYRHFATKEQLIVVYLKSRHDITLAAMSAAIHKAGTDPVQRVCALYDWLYTRANAEFRGCAFLLNKVINRVINRLQTPKILNLNTFLNNPCCHQHNTKSLIVNYLFCINNNSVQSHCTR